MDPVVLSMRYPISIILGERLEKNFLVKKSPSWNELDDDYDDFNCEQEFESDEKTWVVSRNEPESKFKTGSKVIHSLYGEDLSSTVRDLVRMKK